jgi:formylglycine-generating enzyme required for sulfatase activity
VIRGGSFNDSADFLQVGFRDGSNPSYAYNPLGFRFARTN